MFSTYFFHSPLPLSPVFFPPPLRRSARLAGFSQRHHRAPPSPSPWPPHPPPTSRFPAPALPWLHSQGHCRAPMSRDPRWPASPGAPEPVPLCSSAPPRAAREGGAGGGPKYAGTPRYRVHPAPTLLRGNKRIRRRGRRRPRRQQHGLRVVAEEEVGSLATGPLPCSSSASGRGSCTTSSSSRPTRHRYGIQFLLAF